MKHTLLTAGLIVSVLFGISNVSYACPPEPPTAILTVYPSQVKYGRIVTLNGSNSYPDANIIEYAFDFDGDETYDYNETDSNYPDGSFDGKTTHTYNVGGTFTPMLKVKRDNETSDTDTCTLYVLKVKNITQSILYDTIQDAIDDANDNDIITAQPGRYVENLCFTDKQITLTSIDPNDRAVVAKTIIDGNDANSVVIFAPGDANSTITGFTITNGYADTYNGPAYGGGIYVEGVSPTIKNCVITKNIAIGDGGGIYCDGASPIISHCVIAENNAHTYSRGAGMCCMDSSSATITDCIFRNNVGTSNLFAEGGGIYNADFSSITVTNCVFIGNRTNWGGGGIYTGDDGCSTIINCLLTDNYSEFYMGGASGNRSDAEVTLTNCILWDNKAPIYHYEWERQIYWESGGGPSISYCCIQDYGGCSDPCVVDPCDPNGPDGICGTYDDGLMLAVGSSPCIDAGTNTAVSDVPYDIVGHARITDGDHNDTVIVDMGPYEVPTIWFVDANAAADGNGFSWDDAFDSLQDALTDNDINDGNEIWVADGIYEPTDGNDRTISFELKEGLRVYGGFDGNEVGLCQRQWNLYPSILSGDINQPGDINDNSYHVVVGADKALLDGFTVTGGYANGQGGYNSYGGGMCNIGVNTIYENQYCCPTVVNCVFTKNSASTGGGMFNCSNASPTVVSCVFSENSASSEGGGMCNWDESDPQVTNCVFYKNDAGGGGGILLDWAGVTLLNCSFTQNTASSVGGAIYCPEPSYVAAANCILWGDSASSYGNEICLNQGWAHFSYSDVEGCGGSDNWQSGFGTDDGGNIDADPCFVDVDDANGSDGVFLTADDGLMLRSIDVNSPCIDAADGDVATLTDIRGQSRVDINDITNTGIGDPNYVDMGAYEKSE